MEPLAWQVVWRTGISPCLSVESLAALERGLAANDPAILRGKSFTPEFTATNLALDLTATDPVLYGQWKTGGIKTVEEADTALQSISFESDMSVGMPASLRPFFNWWDEQTGKEKAAKANRDLWEEVTAAIATRRTVPAM